MIIKTWLYPNVGDRLNEVVIKGITGTDHHDFIHANLCPNQDNFSVIGSILQFADKNTIVWGSGFLKENYCFDRCVPKRILAVRGPLTRDVVIKLGINCPEVYSDPALLMPKYYQTKTKKQYKLGIILHWADEWLKSSKFKLPDNVIKINHTLPYQEFIDKLNSCEFIASSSLHGIILADAYGIPAIQISLQDRQDQFKFFDYFSTVNRPLFNPLLMNTIEPFKILQSFYNYNLQINLIPLMEVCPFL